MPAKKQVLVIGGGFAGLKLATLLADSADVTLVDRKSYFEVVFANARTAVEPGTIDDLIVPYETTKPHGTTIEGEVVKLTSKQAWLKGKEEPLSFDYAAICTGSDYAYGKSSTPGVEDRKAELRAIHTAIKAAGRVLVVGGGSLGVELAGEILTDCPETQVTLVHSGERLLPQMPARASAAALSWLQGHKCEVLLNDKVDLTGKDLRPGKQTFTTQKGVKVEAGLVLVATGIKVNSSFLEEDLAGAREQGSGAIKVDSHLRVEGHPNVYALGDVTNVPEAKLAFLAMKHAELAAKNIKAAIAAEEKGSSPRLTSWTPSAGLSVQFVSVGRNYGIGQLGWLVLTGWVPTTIKSRGLAGFVSKYRKDLMLAP